MSGVPDSEGDGGVVAFEAGFVHKHRKLVDVEVRVEGENREADLGVP